MKTLLRYIKPDADWSALVQQNIICYSLDGDGQTEDYYYEDFQWNP